MIVMMIMTSNNNSNDTHLTRSPVLWKGQRQRLTFFSTVRFFERLTLSRTQQKTPSILSQARAERTPTSDRVRSRPFPRSKDRWSNSQSPNCSRSTPRRATHHCGSWRTKIGTYAASRTLRSRSGISSRGSATPWCRSSLEAKRISWGRASAT